MHLQTVNDDLFLSISEKCTQDNSLGRDCALPIFLKGFCESEIFKFCAEHLGCLKKFLQSINMDHGELPCFLNKNINIDIIDLIKEITDVYEFCKEKKLKIQNELSCFSKNIISHFDNNFLNNLGNPEKTKIFTRFLDENKRWSVRATKNKQIISKKSNLSVSQMETGCVESIYHGSLYNYKIVEDLKNKKNSFDEISCSNLAFEINKAIDRINESIALEKYGFQRVAISKILHLFEKNFAYSQATILPVKSIKQLEGSDAKRFVELCENFNFSGSKFSIFDHYAEIKLNESQVSALIGEIDTRSYFICFNFEV